MRSCEPWLSPYICFTICFIYLSKPLPYCSFVKSLRNPGSWWFLVSGLPVFLGFGFLALEPQSRLSCISSPAPQHGQLAQKGVHVVAKQGVFHGFLPSYPMPHFSIVVLHGWNTSWLVEKTYAVDHEPSCGVEGTTCMHDAFVVLCAWLSG